MNSHPAITIVGSINMDLTVSTDLFPEQGETVLGKNFHTYYGGKGANQAVAAARLGARVNMIGAVGNDFFGKDSLEHLQREHIDTSAVHTLTGLPTGTATIILSEQDNRIIVAPGANGEVTPQLVENHTALIQNSDMILLQLEIPLPTIAYTIELATKYSIPVILNPAPYQKLPSSLLKKVDYITPNEAEARLLMSDLDIHDPFRKKTLITKGAQGVEIYKDKQEIRVPGYKVSPQDTTGAGDTFNGALATQLALGTTLEGSVSYANAAAALSVTKLGAQNGMPSQKEVEQFLSSQRPD